ncbi:MAG: ComEA family DNA-binding protein [Ignavibacteria bacterium]
MKYIFFTLLILLPVSITYAFIDTTQTVPDTTYLNQTQSQEILLENILDETEDSKLLDYLESLKSSPLDLNSVTQDEIETIPFINSIVAKNIIQYRTQNNGFRYKKELLKVDGITEELYNLVKVYFVVRKSKEDWVVTDYGTVEPDRLRDRTELLGNFSINFRSRFQQDLQTRAGYLNGNYPGSKAKVYNRLNGRYDYNRFQVEANLVIEKDAGETSLTDFTSGFVELRTNKFLKQFVVGDYSLNFGQGIGMWSSLGFSKGIVAVNTIKKHSIGIDSYSSVNESQFFRGAATRLNYKDFDFYAFFSGNYYDATYDTTLNTISSFYFDGYHRTISEKNRTNMVRENLFGGRVLYFTDEIKLGLTYWSSNFSKNILPDTSRNLYLFKGSYAQMASFDYDVIFKNFNLFGEIARSHQGIYAGISALQWNFSKLLDVIVTYRYYPEDFVPVHSFGFGEMNGNTQNETGIYTGISIYPLKSLTINAYYDQFKFPYRSYFVPVPITGNDFLTNLDWKVFKDFKLSVKYKNENKEDVITVQDEFNRAVKKIVTRNQVNLRVGFEYLINNIRLKSRYEYIFVNYSQFAPSNKGYLFFTDVNFKLIKGLTLSSRLIFFETDTYDSRIYEYEEDIKGVMSNIGLYGKGRRWYFLIRYKPFNFLEGAFKYSETYLDGVRTIGSGNDMIFNDINNRLNFSLEVLF